MARFFIDRPIFAIALALMIVFGGTIAAFSLPVARYPQISKPQIVMETNYMGASATTVEQAVAQVVEQNVNGVENMREMNSASTNTGNYILTVTFNLEKNPDMGAVEVQNRVDQAKSSLPTEVNAAGITVSKQSAENVMFFAIHSPNQTYDGLFIQTYAASNVVDPLKRVKGVSTVNEYGPEYAMRVELKPDVMSKLGVTAEDVAAAIKAQNIQAAVGAIGTQPTEEYQEFTYSASAEGRLHTPEEFGEIVVRSEGEKLLLLKDIANICPGMRRDSAVSELDGASAVGYSISLTSDANAIESVAEIHKVIEDVQKRFPPDMELVVMHDSTVFIKESLEKVAHTFFEALVLVFLVVYVFLGDVRSTMVPMLAVPVSLVGTFGAFVLLGFSINTISMFAMILAIGLVVDDAIVVVEAVEHHIQDSGLSPKEATYKAMEEVSGPVVAIACVLAAVFVPVSFMGGSTGLLYKQFALTISVSMMISALVALSLTPALCAMLLRPQVSVTESGEGKGVVQRLIHRFNLWYDNLLERYTGRVGYCLRHAGLVMVCLLVIVILSGVFFRITPTGYVPEEDQGMVMISYNLAEGASTPRGTRAMRELGQKLMELPGVKHLIAVNGYDILAGAPKASAGLMGVFLHDFSDRDVSSFELIRKIWGIGSEMPEVNVLAFNEAALPGLSSTGSISLFVQNLGSNDVQEMSRVAREFVSKARQRPELGTVYTTFNTDTPAYRFEVDRKKAASLKVPVSSIFATLQTFLGGSEVNDFNDFGRTWKVVMQAQPRFRDDVRNMHFFYVRSETGAMIPLDTLVTSEYNMTVPVVTRFDGASSFKVGGSPAAGYSSGQAMEALEQIGAEVLPSNYVIAWAEQSRDEREAGSDSYKLYLVSLVFVFLVLCALYESWSIPLAVLLSVPPAVLGCLASQYFRGQQNDVYMQIAMIMLIGLAAKNAILIVEYAKLNMEKGKDAVTAAIEAARLRLRPILMTSFAFILGCVPLAISTGAGAGARVSMGNAVVGGMTFTTFVGVFLIPVLFVVVERTMSRLR